MDEAFVENRRLRTWEDAPPPPQAAWRIIFRYALLRNLRAWWVVVPLIVATAIIVLTLGINSYAFGTEHPNGVHHTTLFALLFSFLLMGLVFVFLVGTPLLAEDLRFHAPLFYFSKPLRVLDYYLGKAGVLALVLVAVVLVPLVALFLMGLVVAVPNTLPFDGQRWQNEGEFLRGAGDWFYAMAVLLPATVVAVFFAVAVTLCVSAFTRRFWHAAMGLVAIFGGWGLLGLVAGDFSRTAMQHIFGPGGWLYLMFVLPIEMRFGYDVHRGPPPMHHQAAVPAILLAYALVIGLGALAVHLALGRLRRQEELL